MIFWNKMHGAVLAGIALAVISLVMAPALADTAAVPPSSTPAAPLASPAAPTPSPVMVPSSNLSPAQKAALLKIAQQFVTKMSNDLATAQAYLDKLQPDDLRLQKAFDTIPDGETLLLQIKVGEIGIDNPVTAIKEGHDVMISLADFAAAASFPITVDPVEGKADGWFIRQNQHFTLDSKSKTVTSKGKTFPIATDDVKLQDGDLLVKGQSLAKWLDFNLTVDVAGQGMIIKSAQKFPVEEKADRIERSHEADYVLPPPHLPRVDTPPPHFFATPNIDVDLTEGFFKQLRQDTVDPTTGTLSTQSARATSAFTVETNGDLGSLTDRTVITGDAQNEIDSVRTTYSKASDSSNLLGPLHARYYEFGDVDPPNVPLAATSTAGLGVHATNKDPFVTTDTSTQITGEATPGWDVELYREDQYLALSTVGQDGRYTFPNVLLFAGDNHFRIEQYGPEGQMKEETKVITVSPQVYSAGGGAYDVAATLQDTQAYLKGADSNPDKGTPAVVASYAHQLTTTASGQVDLQALQQDGSERGYLHGGVADTLGKTIVNVDTVAASNAAFTGAISARRLIGATSVAGTVQYASPNYDPVGSAPIPSATSLNLTLQGPLPLPLGTHPSYQASTQYLEYGDGTSRADKRLNVNTRVGGLSLSDSVTNTTSTQANITRDITTGTTAVRGNALGIRWRGLANYNIAPVEHVTQYSLDLNKTINPRLSADLALTDDPLVPLKTGILSLSYTGNHATLAPSISYDSHSNLSAYLNMRFGITRNPYTNDIFMTARPIGGDGSLAVRVFLDKDGDNKFGPGDELLEGVTVEAVHDDVLADTDKNGEAFLYTLPVGKLTDVIVESGSNFDPEWVTGIAGVSIRPRPGHVDRVDFPIHLGGMMDGIIYARLPQGPPRAVKDIELALYDGDGKLAMSAQTAYDGYFTMDAIPPGQYFLIVNEKEARADHLVRPPPEPITIGYKGTVLANHNIYLDYGNEGDISVAVEANLGDYPMMNPTIDRAALRNQVVVLNLGTYNSRELEAVIWYKLKTRYATLIGNAHLLVQPADSFASPKTGKNVLRAALPGYDVKDAWNRCRALEAHGERCAVEILPKGLQDVAAAEGVGSR